jgi:predicted DNA-binding protein (MmcQ/YjbR family)
VGIKNQINLLMISIHLFRQIALSLPETTEEPHFEKISFRVKKKIFATYNSVAQRACVKLSAIDQDVFCKTNLNIVHPVENHWGKQGWTLIDLNKVHEDVFIDALKTAYCQVAPIKLADKIRWKE